MTRTLDWDEQDWLNPPSTYRSAPFWSWNDRMVPDRLCRQIEQMRQAGMGGFFMHSRYGLKTPYLSDEWFQAVNACVEKARQLDMKAYLYDEDRWPSGAAGGLVTREHPEYGRQDLVAVAGEGVPPGCESVGHFAVVRDAGGKLVSYRVLEEGRRPANGESLLTFAAGGVAAEAWFNEAPYLDVLNPEAVAEFINVTHQAYADRCGKDFGGLIPAIFTDEPNFHHGRIRAEGLLGQLPWTGGLAMAFRQRRRYDLREHLPELLIAPADPAKRFSQVRHDYWLTLTELYVESFSVQIGRWCDMHHIALSGHYNAEESFYSQITNLGSAMPHYPHQQWPGIDILTDLTPGGKRHGEAPSGESWRGTRITTVKQCASVADQLGRQRVLSETYGCTGWDWPLEGHKYNAGWQFVLGVNFRCPHLSWYSMAGGAKRDYPASIFPHSPWWKYYRLVEDYFARMGLLLTKGKPIRDVLILNPIESAYGVIQADDPASTADLQQPFNELLEGLLNAHFDYDLGDESQAAAGVKCADGTLKLGRMEYRLVLVPPCITLRSTTAALLKRFAAGGGHVLFVGRQPDRIDGRASDELNELVEQSARCGTEMDVVVSTLAGLLQRRVSVTESGGVPQTANDRGLGTPAEAGCVWTMLRQVKGGRILFLQSLDRDTAHRVRVSVQGRAPVVAWDLATGGRRRVHSDKAGDRVEFDLSLPPTGSAMVSLGLASREAAPAAKEPVVAQRLESPGPWVAELAEPNSFPLDYAQLSIEDGAFTAPLPVLAAEDEIRKHYGLPVRRNGGCQPWYLAQTGRADRAVRGRCRLRFTFHVSDVPDRLSLAIERPEDYRILFNGQKVPDGTGGWWIDEDVRTVHLPRAQAGVNELVLDFDYRSDMEIEEPHLIGPFGIRQTGSRRTHDAYTLTAPPAQLAAGSWVGQGLDFYGGAVNYRLIVPEGVWSAISAGKRVRVSLPGVACTCAAVHVNDQTFVLPWAPMSADVTAALLAQQGKTCDVIVVEVIGGRKNILGPLHVPWLPWTGPGEFYREHPQWTNEYLLTDHGLMSPPVFEIIE